MSGNLMRQLKLLVATLAIATFQTDAGSFDWYYDVPSNDEIARTQAQRLALLSFQCCNDQSGHRTKARSQLISCLLQTGGTYNRIPDSYGDSVRFRSADRTGDCGR